MPFYSVDAFDIKALNGLSDGNTAKSDVVNTYRIWLRYELFRGRLSAEQFQASEASLVDFIKARSDTKAHLADLMSSV